ALVVKRAGGKKAGGRRGWAALAPFLAPWGVCLAYSPFFLIWQKFISAVLHDLFKLFSSRRYRSRSALSHFGAVGHQMPRVWLSGVRTIAIKKWPQRLVLQACDFVL